MEDKEAELLCTLAANHLFLAQFEPLRAVLRSLRARNPELARSILQTIVAKGGRFDSILWTRHSCPSPSLLAFLSTLELLQFGDPVSHIWSFDEVGLKLRAEFLLYVQIVSYRVLENIKKNVESEGSGNASKNFDTPVEFLAKDERIRGLDADLGECLRVLDRISDVGLSRLRPDLLMAAVHGEDEEVSEVPAEVGEEEMMVLQGVILENGEIFDVLCLNIEKQMGSVVKEDSGMAITLRSEGKHREIEDKVLRLIQRCVQLAHLDAMKDCIEKNDLDGSISHLRYLHLHYGVEETEYRMVLQSLLRKVLLGKDSYGDNWFQLRDKLLSFYGEALSSSCIHLVQKIQVIQDELLVAEIELSKASETDGVHFPFHLLRKCTANMSSDTASNDNTVGHNIVSSACIRDMFHYARVSGLHVLECVMDASLTAVRAGQLQEAGHILSLFPRLQPLVAVMGWDLLSGRTSLRRELMQLLWTSKSQFLRLEEAPLYSNKSDEGSCVEQLCDLLCYQLDLASFVACVNSGQSWNLKMSLLLSGNDLKDRRDADAQEDPFVENFVLERLSSQSPLHVLFDVVPSIKFQDAIELISMQPITSSLAAWKRMQDIELMHMRYALESAVFALGTMENCTNVQATGSEIALAYLRDLKNHLDAIRNVPRKIMSVNIIISLLYMDDLSCNLVPLSVNGSEEGNVSTGDQEDSSILEMGNKMVVQFTAQLLDILRQNLPSSVSDPDDTLDNNISSGGKQALEWRISHAKHFIEDWDWRLSILQRLLPLSERQWRWKEALTILRAAPSKLLNLCMQRAKYDIGEEAVHRFSLPPEDKATLELAEWVDGSFERSSVEDAVSRAVDGTAAQELDFSSLRSQLGPLAAILLCIDVAASSAVFKSLSLKLLNQAQVMLSEIYPGGSPKNGSTYWDQIHEMAIVSVTKRVLKRFHELLDQDKYPTLQAIFTGEMILLISKEFQRQGHRERALVMLHQMIEDAHQGKRQFLSGKLHNLARAVADEETERDFVAGESPTPVKTRDFQSGPSVVLGLGLRTLKPSSSVLPAGENNILPNSYDVKETGKRILGPFTSKPTTYLSVFILHIAAIGDIVDGTDTTHDFNYFSVIYEWPKDLLTRLVFERGSTDAAGKVAEIMSADFVHEVISACVPPVYPPRSGHGWACIPVVPTFSKSYPESKMLSPTSRDAKPGSYSRASGTPGTPLYPLQLDILKHLVKLSPVRAVLASVFGSSILYRGGDPIVSNSLEDDSLKTPDADRLFLEFSLDHSERFPTLNRWIQMQTNLHRVSEFAVMSDETTSNPVKKTESKTAVKRYREHDSDTESEVDDFIAGKNISSAQPEQKDQTYRHPASQHDSPPWKTSEHDSTVFLSFDWENEAPYERAVERLIDEGKLMDALALSDRFLRSGASDRLLQLLIKLGEQTNPGAEQFQSFSSLRVWSSSWQYCLRMKDKHLAAKLALKYLHRWELDAALNVLTMCNCHLLDNDPLKAEVSQMRAALLRYNRILCADDRYSSWQEVETVCKEDPEGLALRLAEKGAVSPALEVAESASLSIELRRELQGRQLVKLLTADPLNGGGPAEASRFLSSLRDSDDALPVAMSAMQLLPDLRSKQLLVHFFLKRRDSNLSEAEVSRLNLWALGLRVLAALPISWQQKCSSLHEHPHLILEVLLMRKQLQSASLILIEFPSLRDNSVILAYAAKAITISISSPPRETRAAVSVPRAKQKTRIGTPTRSYITSSLSNFQKEARRAFSWTPRQSGEKTVPKDTPRKRKTSGLSQQERVAWEAMAGIQEERVAPYSSDGPERLPSVSIAEEWMLFGDPVKDEAVRSSFRYESAPDITLFKALLSLCSDESVSGKGALSLCINQMQTVLSSQQVPENASMETIGRAYYATETFVQGLLFAKGQLRKFSGGLDSMSNLERFKDADDTSSDAGSSSVGSQSTDELAEVLGQVEVWLGRAELLQSLLGSGIAASIDDIADRDSSSRLRDRLITEERYSMAVYTSKKCKIDAFPVWNAWGHALIRMEHYAQARVKFKQAFQLHKDDPESVVLDIINTIEGGAPVDVSSVRSMYEHLAKSAPAILDDSLSADSYLNVLYMPSTFPRSERSRRSQEAATDSLTENSELEDGPRSNLDSVRYLECVNYLQEYGRQHLLGFMFKHGHFKDACFLFFPPNSVPPPPQPSSLGTVNSSLSPQRPDALATDYGTIDDLCGLCIGYGAMPVLEEVIAARVPTSESQDASVNQHTAAALARICLYCETHKHFNFLYKFQVIKKDHVAAGLCCIQLYMNSSSQEEAVSHLEHAKMHFEEGLSARYKATDSTKVVTKGIRGKSASEKLSEEGLVKFSARVSIQVDVVKCFNAEGPQWKYSLFGNPNDPETFRRRCEIAEALAEKNFDLAFQVIYEFNLPAVDIYAGVAASLAERKKGGQLTEFFRNIKGTIEDDDWDQVLGAAINVYANRHKERPDRLIDMLTSSHRKVLACVVCGRLKSAFQIASKSGSVADVQYVAHQALHANALPVLDMCKQWLAQYM
ncbi:OLC1v1030104C1 [Oldenlandia corymbosa var. corymbosa]|uniref:OLC1v1030104C1 n=1 Tax=Oldenlandia corymbosa var. corymbosa TaxID=529605 RepID=A0AAV1CFD2_OLDCO|nr:OLC1v1030104C1 [Oldenlandia corymbosa var. corymbosa]